VSSPITADVLAQGVLDGNRRHLARACSLVESTTAADRDVAAALLERIMPHTGHSRRLGMTGSPGVGKSTLVEAFGLRLCEAGRRVAVLAVDPSSRRTGGSILGDKVRMAHLSLHDNAFVRPSPSRLALGGATSTTRECILLCEAAGYDTIIVETVGVGQSEIDVADMVDLFLLLVLPTAGDDIQGIKRGIMEVADAVVVTKADISPEATRRAIAMLKGALRLMLPSQEGWNVPVLGLSAVDGDGLADLEAVCDGFFDGSRMSAIADRRAAQRIRWFDHVLNDRLLDLLGERTDMRAMLDELRARVLDGTVSPAAALHRFFSSLTITMRPLP